MEFSLPGSDSTALAGSDTGVTVLIPEANLRRFATRAFATPPDDLVPNAAVRGGLLPPDIRRSIGRDQQGLFITVATTTVGDIEIDNTSGELDEIGDRYEAAQRPLRLRVGLGTATSLGRSTAAAGYTWVAGGGGAYTWSGYSWGATNATPSTEFALVFRGTTSFVSHERDRLRVRVQDPADKLRRPILATTYAGSGGYEGGPDLAGRTRPLVFGNCLNVPATQNDSGLLIYQINDGPVMEIEGVYDGGVALDGVIDVPTYVDLENLEQGDESQGIDGDIYPGQYATCIAEGFFRLGGSPAGQVTADVRGIGLKSEIIIGDDSEPFSDGTFYTDGTGWAALGSTIISSQYAGTAAVIVLQLLESHAKLAEEEIDRAQILQADEQHPDKAGLFINSGETVTVEDACRRLAFSLGAVLLPNLLGQYRLQYLEPPTPSSSITLSPVNIVSLERQDLPYVSPFTTWRMGYGPNWTVMSEGDVFPAADPARKQFVARELAYIQQFDDVANAVIPTDRRAQIDGLLNDGVAAQFALQRLRRFYSVGRRLFSVRVKGMLFRADLLDTVRVVYPRHGLNNGRNFVVIEAYEQARESVTDLLLFG